MALSAKQTEELHKCILGYLKSSGFEEAYEVFRKSTNLTPESKHETMLAQKWRSILRLQKRIVELEAENKQLAEDAKAPGPKKRDQSLTLPREPALHTLSGHRGVITAVLFHPIYSLIVTSGEDSTIKVWDYESGKFERTLSGHQDTVQDLAFNASGSLLASCSADLSIKLWDTSAFTCIKTLQGHDHVSGVRFLPSGDFLVSSSRDKKIKGWDTSTGYCVRTYSGHEGWVRKVAVSPDGTLMASCSSDKTIRIWDIKTGKCLHVLKEHEHVVEVVCFSDKKADAIIEKAVAKPSAGPVADGKKADSLIESKDKSSEAGGAYLLSGSRDRTIRLWEVATGICLKTFVGHDNWVRAVLFHPSGQYFVSSADDKTIRIWDLSKQGRQVKKMENAHELFVTCLDWNRSIPLLASGGTDTILKVWECRA